jgi:hypothetical protein
MTALAYILGALLAAAAVVGVALPFVRSAEVDLGDRFDDLDPAAERLLVLAEQRDRALEALKELEFDHRTGKISDEDYQEQIGPLRQEAAAALRSLEADRSA